MVAKSRSPKVEPKKIIAVKPKKSHTSLIVNQEIAKIISNEANLATHSTGKWLNKMKMSLTKKCMNVLFANIAFR